MYLVTDKAVKGASRTGVGLPDKTGGSESSSRSLSGEVNLKRVEPGGFNAELGS